MARFLSTAWFARLGELTEPASRSSQAGDGLVLEQVVRRAPEGVVRYHVVIDDGQSRVVLGAAPSPDVTFTSDYATASAIARGDLPAQTALVEGRLRVRGDMSRLGQRAPDLAAIDPIPPPLRAETTY